MKMDYKIIRTYCDINGFVFVWGQVALTAVLAGIYFYPKPLCIDYQLVLLFMIGLGVLDLMWLLLFVTGSIYWIRNGAIVSYSRGTRYYQYPNDASSIIVVNGAFGRRGLTTFIDGKEIPIPIIFFCNGDASELEIQKYDHKLNLDNFYSFADRLGMLRAHGFIYKKDLAELIASDYTGEIYVAKSVLDDFGKELSGYYGKWNKADKTLHIINDTE